MQGCEIIQVSNKLPSGSYARVKCYDIGKGFDRYTVVYMDRSPEQKKRRNTLGPLYECVGISGHSECVIGKHLGKRIPFDSLPDVLKRIVISDLQEEQ